MTLQLTTGAINRILEGERPDKPILQLLGAKPIGNGSDRFRMLVSDGTSCHPYSLLGTQLIDRFNNREFEKFTVVRLDNYICNTINAQRTILVLLDMTVIARGEDVGDKLGAPSILSNIDNKNQQPQVQTNGPSVQTNGPPAQRSVQPQTVSPNQVSSNQVSSRARNVNSISNMDTSSSSALDVNIHPIASLTPYQNKWTIRVRVTSKKPIRNWSNSRGDGKLFSMDLCDESGEIRCTIFTNEVDKFYDMIEENKVYYISKASMKPANKQYSSLKNDYELTFNGETTVVPCNDNISAIPNQVYNFKEIAELQKVNPGTLVDVIGVCKSFGEMATLTAKATGKELKKRDLQIVDKSNMEINLTLWDVTAENFDGSTFPVLAIKGGRLSDYGGRSLGLLNSSSFAINPDIHEAHVLRGWYEQEGMNKTTVSITTRGGTGSMAVNNWKTFAQTKAEQLGMGEKPDYYNCKATVVMVKKENCMYQACPGENCSKKVTDLNNGRFRCDKCDKEYPDFKWRFLLSLSVSDFSDNIWVTVFQETAELMLDIKAQEMGNLKMNNQEEFEDILSDLNFKSFTFQMRVKMESYNEESRLKTIVTSADSLRVEYYAEKLLKDIKEMEQHIQNDSFN